MPTSPASASPIRLLARRIGMALIALVIVSAQGLLTAADAGVWMSLGRSGQRPVTVHGVTAIVAGGGQTLVLRADGSLLSWGTDNLALPTGLTGVVAITGGAKLMAALDADGRVTAWGSLASLLPAGLTGVASIATGNNHVLVLKRDGSVLAYGSNTFGQASVPANLGVVTAIAAGSNHSAALRADGTLAAWGLGAGAVVPGGLTTVTAIAAGGSQTLALKADGTVVQIGSGLTLPSGLTQVVGIASTGGVFAARKADGTVLSSAPVPSGLSGVTAIAAGLNHAVALKADGSLVTWGSEDTRFDVLPPVAGTGIATIIDRSQYAMALTDAGTLLPWGVSAQGVLEVPPQAVSLRTLALRQDGVLALRQDGTLVTWGQGFVHTSRPAGLTGITAVAVGESIALAVKADGTVAAWGPGATGALAVPAGLSGVTAVGAGYDHACALRTDGTVVAWGAADRTGVPLGLSGVTAIAVGDYHSLALKGDGTVAAWGTSAAATALPAGLGGVVAIAAGQSHSLALKSDGTVVAWGSNFYGESTIPAGLGGVTAIAGGKNKSWLKVAARPVNAVTVTTTEVVRDGAAHTATIRTANGRPPTRITYNGSAQPPSALGVYTVFAEADYFDSTGSATGTLGIKLAQTVTFPALAPVVYGTAPIALAATASSGLSITYTVESGPGTVSGSALTVTGAGTIVVRASQADSDLYVAASAVQTLAVAKAPLTVTPVGQSRAYGAANPALTCTATGLLFADTVASALTGSPATTATATSPVGTYPITMGSLTSASYTLTWAADGVLTVTAAPLAGTADDQARAPGAANPALTYWITGYLNGDAAAVVTGSPLLTTPATAASLAGSYPISVDVTPMRAANYVFTGVAGTLTVADQVLRVTAANAARLEGGDNPVFTYTVTGFTGGATMAAVSGSPVLSTPATAASAPGAYPIRVDVSGMSAAGYFILGVAGTLQVVDPDAASPSAGGGGGGGCGLGGGAALILLPLLLALRFVRLRARPDR